MSAKSPLLQFSKPTNIPLLPNYLHSSITMKLVYGDLTRADLIKQGDYIENPATQTVHEVLFIQPLSSFGNGKFKSSYLFRLAGEDVRGGELWVCFLSNEYAQIVLDTDKKALIIPAFVKKKPAITKPKKFSFKPNPVPEKKKLKARFKKR